MADLITLWQNFLLVALRCGFLLYFSPPWNSRFLPPLIRVSLILGLALALTPAAATYLPPFPTGLGEALPLVLREFLLGLSWCLLFRLVFAGIQMAGDLVAIQMGFGVATLFDPQTQGQNTYLAELMVMLATLLFLVSDGHHVLLILLMRSFEEIPLAGNLLFPRPLIAGMEELVRLMGFLTIQVLAPVLGLMFLVHLGLGLVARAVPQVQIMFVSLPLTIPLGLFFFSMTLMVAGPVLAERLLALQIPLARMLTVWQG